MSAPQPSPMPTPDLAGLLRRPAKRPAPDVPESRPAPEPASALLDAPQEPPAAIVTGPTDAKPKPKPANRSQGARPVAVRPAGGRSNHDQSAGAAPPRQYLRSIVVYLPRDLHRRLREAAAERGTTATALALEAVNATHTQLAHELAREDAGRTGDGDLFDIPQARTVAEPSVQTTIRVTDSQLQTLEALAASHSVNRSRMIAAAVRLHLG